MNDIKFIEIRRRKGAHGWTIVDAHKFDELNQFNWHTSTRYVRRSIRVDGKKTTTSMHHHVKPPKKGEVIHHINHNELDNRECNLMPCTPQENSQHRKKPITGTTSNFKGVCINPCIKGKPFIAQTAIKGKYKNLGRYATEREAALAYDAAVMEHQKMPLTNKMLGLL